MVFSGRHRCRHHRAEAEGKPKSNDQPRYIAPRCQPLDRCFEFLGPSDSTSTAGIIVAFALHRHASENFAL